MNTEKLDELYHAAEDAGREFYVEFHPEFDIIEYVEIDGDVIYNDEYEDEVQDAFWTRDSYRVAEGYWRQ